MNKNDYENFKNFWAPNESNIDDLIEKSVEIDAMKSAVQFDQLQELKELNDKIEEDRIKNKKNKRFGTITTIISITLALASFIVAIIAICK